MVALTDLQAIDEALVDVKRELRRALDLFPPLKSGHEGKAVIEEELDELWDLVKSNRAGSEDARAEAIQIAAMAIRYAIELT